MLYDICDGSIFQNDNYFKDHPDALVIILYHDELEVCNPLGSKAGIHKVDMFYYTLAKFHSKVSVQASCCSSTCNCQCQLCQEIWH